MNIEQLKKEIKAVVAAKKEQDEFLRKLEDLFGDHVCDSKYGETIFTALEGWIDLVDKLIDEGASKSDEGGWLSWYLYDLSSGCYENQTDKPSVYIQGKEFYINNLEQFLEFVEYLKKEEE